MKKYDIYLPLQYNDGRWIESEKFDQVDDFLYERFGGLTSVMREFPLRRLWAGESEAYRDLIIIYTAVDFEPSESTTQFFEGYKETLKSQFQQEEILITVQEIGIFA
ncbi:MAG: hypothetical protein O7E52_03665 [Candidatus Poribacteria bacterium]|nr:hypothetical protein [Candidatus Poribacteria bacterium]